MVAHLLVTFINPFVFVPAVAMAEGFMSSGCTSVCPSHVNATCEEHFEGIS